MLHETFMSLAEAAHQLVSNWRLTALLVLLYMALLASVGLLVVTREATLAQITLTFLLAVAAPVLFFILQAASANNLARRGTLSLLIKSTMDVWKLAVVSFPLLVLGVGLLLLLNKAEANLSTDATAEVNRGVAFITTIRYLVYGFVLPLVLIKVWISTVQSGLVSSIKNLPRLAANALSPRSVLTYMCGVIAFALLPYYIIFHTTPIANPWLELAILVGRLVLAFGLALIGWVITVRALSITAVKDHAGNHL